MTLLFISVGALILAFVLALMKGGNKSDSSNMDGRTMSCPLSYCVVDIETTGLDPLKHEITEIAAIRVRDGEIVDRFSELVAIKGKIPPVVVKKTHITKEMLKDARQPSEVLSDLIAFIQDDILLGYNIDKFDKPFINHHCHLALGTIISNRTFDVWALAKKALPGRDSYKLDDLRFEFQIYGEGHRALTDCEDTHTIYRAIVSKAVIESQLKKKVRKSIHDLSDNELRAMFGDDWTIARDCINEKKRMIRQGLDTDWENLARNNGWGSEPATSGQQYMIQSRGGKTPIGLTKLEASRIIDELLLRESVASMRRRLDREAEKEARKAEREAKKAAREAAKVEKEAAKAARAEELAAKKAAKEAEREHYDGPRRRLKPETLHNWRNQFAGLWNKILADDIIELHEVAELKTWLNKHKRRRDDYFKMLQVIGEVENVGEVSGEHTMALYEAATEVIDQLHNDDREVDSPEVSPEDVVAEDD